MTHMPKKTEEAWDNRELGATEKFVGKASKEESLKLDEGLDLQVISIRLQKSLIEALKNIAAEDGIGYQPFMRQILNQYVKKVLSEKTNRKVTGKIIVNKYNNL